MVSGKNIAMTVMGRGVHIQVDWNLRKRDTDLQNRLIEVVKSGKRTDILVPTDILEIAVPGRHPNQGVHGPESHPVFGWHVRQGKREPRFSRSAGSILNVIAATQIANQVIEKGDVLSRIYWAAGRTPDMEVYAPPGWSQGIVLAKAFVKMASQRILESDLTNVFEPGNLNTWDDLVCSFINLVVNGYEHVIVISVEVHIPRIQRIIDLILGPKIEVLFGPGTMPAVSYISSEDVLIDDPYWGPKIIKARASQGYASSLARENNGEAAMLNGTHRFYREIVSQHHKPLDYMSFDEVVEFT